MCDLSKQRPAYCQPLEPPASLIETVRVDVEYEMKSAWTLHEEYHNPTSNSTEDSLVGESVFVSTYVDIFEYGEYEIDMTGVQGKICVIGQIHSIR
jgi:hypothetical protein